MWSALVWARAALQPGRPDPRLPSFRSEPLSHGWHGCAIAHPLYSNWPASDLHSRLLLPLNVISHFKSQYSMHIKEYALVIYAYVTNYPTMQQLKIANNYYLSF